MFRFSRRAAAIFALATALFAVVALQVAIADDKELAQVLRAGGLVIVVRHGATFPDQADTDPLHPENIAAQRNLMLASLSSNRRRRGCAALSSPVDANSN